MNGNTKPTIQGFFGSELFNSRDLIGNLYLVEALEKHSHYQFYLAQHECNQKVTHKRIRDRDIRGLLSSEVAIFAFDGVELDSGTVVEFMQAKMLDIPAVVYRTDFRGGSGEESIDDKKNKWNLMVSFYPRTKIVYMNAILDYQVVYQKVNGDSAPAQAVAEAYSEYMAQILVDAMDQVMETPPILNPQEKSKVKEQCIKLWGVDMATDQG